MLTKANILPKINKRINSSLPFLWTQKIVTFCDSLPAAKVLLFVAFKMLPFATSCGLKPENSCRFLRFKNARICKGIKHKNL
jgi:hypothetical protein